MSKKPEYYTDYVDGDYDPTLFGPDGFECYLGEPEDRTFYRDAAPMVDKLNEQADRIKELESRTQWQDIETAPKDGSWILLYTVEGWTEEGQWVEEEPDSTDCMGSDAGWMTRSASTFPGRSFGNPKYHSEPFNPPTHWMEKPEAPKED